MNASFGELGRLLDRSRELEAEVHRLLGGKERQLFDDSPRALATLGAAQVSMEHGSALRLLLARPLPTSGVSLLRLQHETLTRAVWLLYAAKDQQVERLVAPLDAAAERAASKLPMTKTMLDDIVGKAPTGAVEMLMHFKDGSAPALHSFVHGGIHAIQRGLAGYPVELLANVVRSSNGLYTMAGMLLANLSGDPGVSKRMSKIQPRFADCLPPLSGPPRPPDPDAKPA